MVYAARIPEAEGFEWPHHRQIGSQLDNPVEMYAVTLLVLLDHRQASLVVVQLPQKAVQVGDRLEAAIGTLRRRIGSLLSRGCIASPRLLGRHPHRVAPLRRRDGFSTVSRVVSASGWRRQQAPARVAGLAFIQHKRADSCVSASGDFLQRRACRGRLCVHWLAHPRPVVAAAIAQLQVRKERGVAAEGAHDVIAQRGARQRVRQRARAAGQAHGDAGLVEGAA
mmetsp:Transcript_17278/g.53558  ORF Transcript_17278/g.53558 Transcript_17278/m.53558 type:complete len:224 (+) Transcript_17278:459-1130(+)